MTYWDKWMMKYLLVKKYYEINGNIDIPRFYEVDGIRLGSWLSHQRQAYKGKNNSKLTIEQIELLNKLKIKWDVAIDSWDEAYKELKKYKRRYGDINVSRDYKIRNVNLGQWLTTQRISYFGKSTYKITKEHIKLLNILDIDWAPKKTELLNRKITVDNKNKYNEVLIERVNHVIDDLVYEEINEIDSSNQDSIEKIMIKRIWR